MRILLSNDDGIFAPGLSAMYRAIKDLGEITVVAPAEHQSGASHAISLKKLTARRVTIDGESPFTGVAVGGSPADCVRLAILELMDSPPDLVISGINSGANVGVHVFYSGTVAAAAEATMLSVPGIAFSAMYDRTPPPDFQQAAPICRKVLMNLISAGLQKDDLINVNIPLLGDKPPRGVRLARQSRAESRDIYKLDEEGTEDTYLVACGDFHQPSQDTDIRALRDGFVTVTPLHVDRTHRKRLKTLKQNNWDGIL